MNRVFNIVLVFITVIIMVGCTNSQAEVAFTYEGSDVQKELFIPELIDMTDDQSTYEITVDQTEFAFFDGIVEDTKSYNGQGYLGKTLKLRNGSTFYPVITNNIDEITTVHWHGLEVNGENDGAAGVIAQVRPGETKTYELAVDQQAATIWYHPHAYGTTASQVYEGLAGLIIIEDDNSDDLKLPNEYGVNDIPLVLQAKLFDEEGRLSFRMDGHDEDLNFEDPKGESSETTEGFVILSNGYQNPYLEVSNELVRFRVLNGSNHGVMDLSMSDGSKVNVIATDGGFLETAQSKEKVEIVAGERFEFLVDLTEYKLGDYIEIIANNQIVLCLRITEERNNKADIPEEMNEIIPFEEYRNQPIDEVFVMANDLINGTPYEIGVMNYHFELGRVYHFEIINKSWENHSFHIHNSQFLVMEVNGEEVDYAEYGWKDTVYLRPKETMIIQVQFNHPGMFMLHCHILIHEEKGMMHHFMVR